MNDNNEKKSIFRIIKESFSGRRFRNGAYVTMISAVVIIIILVANMLISKMNIQFDLSAQNMYTLTKDTKDIAKDLKDDVTIYYLAQASTEEELFKNILKQYDAASDKITVVTKDPVLYPQFATKYTDEKVTDNSMLVVDNTNNRAKYIDYNDLLVQEMNYQTYQTETTGIDVEGKLTSAIQYVTSEDLPIMYVVKDHGEEVPGTAFNTAMGKLNVEIKTISTVTQKTIPEDCDILYINAPQTDFSDAETTMIKDYMSKGGKAIITLNYNSDGLKNFQSILEYYGVQVVKGIVIEGDTNKRAAVDPYALVPDIASHDITDHALKNTTPLFMYAPSGLNISDTKRSSLTITPLLTTSDASYSKTKGADMQTIEKEDGDISGPFNIGLLSEDTYDNVTSDLVVFSSDFTFKDDGLQYSNYDLLTGTIGYLVGDTNMLSIPTKSLSDPQITITQYKALMIGGITTILIPVGIMILGAVVSYKRRRK